jgi:hypothetical protein
MGGENRLKRADFRPKNGVFGGVLFTVKIMGASPGDSCNVLIISTLQEMMDHDSTPERGVFW